jgi:PAS domain S-box-containing protein
MTSGVLTLDLEGRVITMNSSMEYLTGLDRGILGRYAIEVFGGAQEVLEALLETLSNAVPVRLPSVAISRADGSIVLAEVTTSPLRGSEAKALGVVGVFRDLTAIRELEGQLRRADRLAAVGALAAGLAHEIKNPLVSLRTYTQLLPERFNDEGYRRKFREVVLPELDRINEIVEGLLDLSRPARLVFDRVSLPWVVDRILLLYSGPIEEKKIQVVRDDAYDLLAVRADAEYLYRAIMNIVANAIESMDSGGRLTITTKASSAVAVFPYSLPKGLNSWVKIEPESCVKSDGFTASVS